MAAGPEAPSNPKHDIGRAVLPTRARPQIDTRPGRPKHAFGAGFSGVGAIDPEHAFGAKPPRGRGGFPYRASLAHLAHGAERGVHRTFVLGHL